MTLEMGTLLKDRFRLLRPLGEGGMGEVYLGEDERGGAAEGRPVAIKALRSELNEKHALFLRRFQEEIEILKRLNEPGIPAFVDAFEEHSRSFFVMEYVEGHSLESLLDLSPLGLRPDMVAAVGIQVLKILEALHSQTPPLIHRDIKPANLIIRRQDESVFLVDFGLAREFHQEAAARTLVGTVGYCPLEQLQGHPEPRSDLYALGATLFELLTGQIPTPLSIPPVRSVQPEVPEPLAQMVDRAVQQKPEDRFANATCMRQALEEVRRQIGAFNSRHVRKRSSGDRADQLLASWGKTEAQLMQAPLTRKIQDRRSSWVGLAVLSSLIGFCGFKAAGHHRYQNAQRSLVKDAFPDGRPGPGWLLSEASGIFPADGLGLGEPSSSHQRAGALFQTSPARTTQVLSFRVRNLKGSSRVLVYSQPWGLNLEPSGKGYSLKVVQLTADFSLKNGNFQWYQGCQPLALTGLEGQEIRLTINGRSAQIQINHHTKRRFNVPQGWKGEQSGAVLLNADRNARCVLRNFRLR